MTIGAEILYNDGVSEELIAGTITYEHTPTRVNIAFTIGGALKSNVVLVDAKSGDHILPECAVLAEAYQAPPTVDPDVSDPELVDSPEPEPEGEPEEPVEVDASEPATAGDEVA